MQPCRQHKSLGIVLIFLYACCLYQDPRQVRHSVLRFIKYGHNVPIYEFAIFAIPEVYFQHKILKKAQLYISIKITSQHLVWNEINVLI